MMDASLISIKHRTFQSITKKKKIGLTCINEKKNLKDARQKLPQKQYNIYVSIG